MKLYVLMRYDISGYHPDELVAVCSSDEKAEGLKARLRDKSDYYIRPVVPNELLPEVEVPDAPQ